MEGKTIVKLIERESMVYSMHGSTKWDDYPYLAPVKSWDVCVINPSNEFTYTKDKGFVDDFGGSRKEAEDYAIEVALTIEKEGHRVDFEFNYFNLKRENIELKGGERE